MIIKATEENRTQIMEYCLDEPNINLFIIGDIENFGFNTEFQEVWFQKENNDIKVIVLRYHQNFIIYSKEMDFKVDEVIDLIINKEATVISGKLSVIEVLYKELYDRYNKREMYFCELKDTSNLIADLDGIKVAISEDAMEIAEVYGEISEFKGMYSDNLIERYNQINSRITSREGLHMFIRENGKIIAHGNTTAETSVNGMIGGIFTLTNYRNNGLASKMVSALAKSLISRGKYACLFYHNKDAGRIYTRLGFREIDKWAMLSKK